MVDNYYGDGDSFDIISDEQITQTFEPPSSSTAHTHHFLNTIYLPVDHRKSRQIRLKGPQNCLDVMKHTKYTHTHDRIDRGLSKLILIASLIPHIRDQGDS